MGTRLNLLYNSGNLKVPLDLNNPYAKPWRVLVSRIAWILRSVLRRANHYHAFLSSDDKYFLFLLLVWTISEAKHPYPDFSRHEICQMCESTFYAVIRKGEGFKSSLWNVPRSWQVINYLVYVFIYILYIEIEDGNLARGRVLFYFTLF